MSDRGIELQLPQYERSMLVEADYITWEASHRTGVTLRSVQGDTYAMIDRPNLEGFSLVQGDEVLVTTTPPPGATGANLRYRRRTQISNGQRSVAFLLGWAPMGPVMRWEPPELPDWRDYFSSDEGPWKAPDPCDGEV